MDEADEPYPISRTYWELEFDVREDPAVLPPLEEPDDEVLVGDTVASLSAESPCFQRLEEAWYGLKTEVELLFWGW